MFIHTTSPPFYLLFFLILCCIIYLESEVFILPNLSDNLIDSINSLQDVNRNYNLADYQYEIICNYIKDFQNELDDQHEVAIQLASFGQSIILNVTDIGYSNPCIIDFYGYYNGSKSHLIQHINQLSFLLLSVPKSNPKKPARRIGFSIPTNSSN